MLNRVQARWLAALLAQPTAPFREHRVMQTAAAYLDRAGVPHFSDPVGNLVVGARSPAEYKSLLAERGREPVRLFVAHTDHPGFHGLRWLGPDRLQVRWFGGGPTSHLAGSPVWVASAQRPPVPGRLVRARFAGRGAATGEVQLDAGGFSGRRPGASTLFGGFRFRAVLRRRGHRIYGTAMDDLIGVFALLFTAAAAFHGRARRPPLLGLLTRAEEVGAVGFAAHLRLGWLERAARPLVCVSLEASRTRPGALIGQGPVVRLGDRSTVFDPGPLKVVADLAAAVLPDGHQRCHLEGGTCEAAAAIAWGLPAVGLAVALGNYHNQPLENGGPGPAPEFVSLRDVTGLLRLTCALMRPGLPWDHPWQGVRRRFNQALRRHRRRLTDALSRRRPSRS